MVHTVQQGEHLSRIALRYGFRDFHTIWDHPDNAELKALRDNPNVLLPGDCLFVPEKEQRQEGCSTSQSHTFRVPLPRLRLVVVLRDVNGKPKPSCQCEIDIDGQVKTLTTGADGKIDEPIPIPSRDGLLRVDGREYRLVIGELDPVEEQSGWFARLRNLGYYLGRGDTLDEVELQSAVEEFQCDYGLEVDGDCGPATQARLKEIYGC